MTINWTTFTDRGNVASTILDSLADATLSAASTAISNQNNLDTHALIEINLGSLNPTGTPYLELYMTKAPDNTNYEEAPVIAGTSRNTLIATLPVPTGTATKRVMTGLITIPPCPIRFYVGNQLNVTMAASGNTIDVYTANLQDV
jgi:hypothetical protein